jgi:hypothetical protein
VRLVVAAVVVLALVVLPIRAVLVVTDTIFPLGLVNLLGRHTKVLVVVGVVLLLVVLLVLVAWQGKQLGQEIMLPQIVVLVVVEPYLVTVVLVALVSFMSVIEQVRRN